MSERIEPIILINLINRESYMRRVLPYLKADYFADEDKILFEKIKSYIDKYNSLPSISALSIALSEDKELSETEYKSAEKYLSEIVYDAAADENWLIDSTEKLCQDKAIYNALLKSIKIADGKSKKEDKGDIPKLLTDALSVSFDPSIGHDYLEDAEERYNWYHEKEEKIPFDLEMFNKITEGGFAKKTLNIFMAGIGVGKTLCMCHLAASYLSLGKNVLYITLEMAQKKIAHRIDANLMNIPMREMIELPKSTFSKKIESIKSKSPGKLKIKEYPTASANCNHFRHLLTELKLKKNFMPDVIFIDYLNIASSSRIKRGPSSYDYVKSIAEEIRGLAVEFDVPVISATQTNREGFVSSALGLQNASESFGVPATADFFVGITTSEELNALGQYCVTQLKNRYGDVSMNKKFVIGVDKAKMRLFDLEKSAQSNIVDSGQDDEKDDTPGFDKTKFGGKMKSESGFMSRGKKRDYSDMDMF